MDDFWAIHSTFGVSHRNMDNLTKFDIIHENIDNFT